MDRRTSIGVVAGSILAAPLESLAQPAGKTVRIGRLSPLSAEADVPLLAAFRRGMRDLGWVEGEKFSIESHAKCAERERVNVPTPLLP
jgi:putative ABC transport system substrate-binding protein